MTEDRITAIREALAESYQIANGPLRDARAEEVVARAEETGDIPLLLDCLVGLMTAYQFSADRGKMLVAFSRTLQLWDEDSSRFDEHQTHALFWWFKWVTGSMLSFPEIPLASIEQWLAEMGRRYRLAGHSVRTVAWEDFVVGWHLGDEERAERSLAQVRSLDRDEMSDCRACEPGTMGEWAAERGADDQALELWTPILAGRLTCAEEPHRVLSKSLLPLVRLGRVDEARANHLRGYRLARGKESLIGTVARHIEFCALTGNEARGLELLAEHSFHIDGHANPRSRLALLESAALLLTRLDADGFGDHPTTGPAGPSWTVAELLAHTDEDRRSLAARFDARNGSTHMSTRSDAAVRQTPLLERLPLGTAAAALRKRARPVTAPTVAVTSDETFAELVQRARQVRDTGHPSTRQLWLQVEAEAASGAADLDADQVLRAELAVQRAMRLTGTEADRAAAEFTDAAEAYERAGLPADAALNSGRAALALALAHRPQEARQASDQALARLLAADPDPRRHASALLGRAKTLAFLAEHAAAEQSADGGADAIGSQAGDPQAGASQVGDVRAGDAQAGDAQVGDAQVGDAQAGASQAATPQAATVSAATAQDGIGGGSEPARSAEADLDAARAAVAEALAVLDPLLGTDADADGRLGSVAADARRLQAGLAREDVEAQARLLRESADGYLAAGRPWYAAEPLRALAHLRVRAGDPEAARELALEALGQGDGLLDDEDQGLLHLLVADLSGHLDDHEASARHALEASRWLDEAGLDAGPGAAARFRLALAYQGLGRHGEAAEVLQSALPALLEHGPETAVAARRNLAESLARLGDHEARAEQLLQALAVTAEWPDRGAHAQLAWGTAEALASAGRLDESVAAYQEVTRLWRELDAPIPVIRTLRARAWVLVRGDKPDVPGARELFAEAAETVAEALAAQEAAPEATDPDEAEWRARFREELLAEQADTTRQLAAVLTEHGDPTPWAESGRLYLQAAEGFAALGPERAGAHANALLRAAECVEELDEDAAARAHATTALAVAEAGGEELEHLVNQARHFLGWLDHKAAEGSAADSATNSAADSAED